MSDYEIEYRDERIKELEDIVKGTIRETGRYSPSKQKYEINTSSILTKLIQEAGRWCECYASDLFILWGAVEETLRNRDFEDVKFVFAFRKFGVDSEYGYENNKHSYHYYRAVWTLDIEAFEDGKMEMTLHR